MDRRAHSCHSTIQRALCNCVGMAWRKKCVRKKKHKYQFGAIEMLCPSQQPTIRALYLRATSRMPCLRWRAAHWWGKRGSGLDRVYAHILSLTHICMWPSPSAQRTQKAWHCARTWVGRLQATNIHTIHIVPLRVHRQHKRKRQTVGQLPCWRAI